MVENKNNFLKKEVFFDKVQNSINLEILKIFMKHEIARYEKVTKIVKVFIDVQAINFVTFHKTEIIKQNKANKKIDSKVNLNSVDILCLIY